MANDYFKFKQFTIFQTNVAMKVCTDSCLFGAWVAKYQNIQNNHTILDIGTGTGLLALMLAQNAGIFKIDALELDKNATIQANDNFKQSIFSNKIQLIETDLLAFKAKSLYDIIICNPPFYEKELQSSNSSKNLAMHSTQLSHHKLIESTANLLTANGSFWVLLPNSYENKFIEIANNQNFFLHSKVNVYNNQKLKPFRTILQLKLASCNQIIANKLVIKDELNQYTNEFKQLLAPYYINL